eukprot:5039329-Alexandrium_andersonii.AAC.1
MSASLVGSEMCIRDRGKTQTTAVSKAGTVRGVGPPKIRDQLSPGVVPVSYTHLTLPTICSV